MRRVVITGAGVVSPFGCTIDAFWDGLISGRSTTKSLSELTSWHLFEGCLEQFDSKVIAEVEQFDPEAHGLPPQVCKQDRYVQFAVAAALAALCDSGLDHPKDDWQDRFGIALATSIGPARTTEAVFCATTARGTAPVDSAQIPERFYLDCIFNTPSILLAQMLDLHGPCLTLSTACASGVDIVGHAYECILDNDADIMLTGASEAPITPARFGGANAIQCVTSQYNDEPAQASRPFDVGHSGFVLGEGAGFVLLEERERALARGATIYGEIVGFGRTCNAKDMVSLEPAWASNLSRAITEALCQAQLSPVDIHYIQAHGSSTAQNDTFETLAFKETLGDAVYHIPISANKSMLGHPLGAAGVFGVIATALSFLHGYIHPTINLEELDPQCDLDYVPDTPRPWNATNAMVIGNGFSGSHAALILRRDQRSHTNF